MLYTELEFSLDIVEIIEKLRVAGHNLRILGECLENNPTGISLSDELLEPVGKGHQFNLKLFSERYDWKELSQKLTLLKRKREELEEITRCLYPVRAKLEKD